jgi:hypothetical protein
LPYFPPERNALLDFRYLIEELKSNYPQYEVEVLCKMIPAGLGGKVQVSWRNAAPDESPCNLKGCCY